MLGLVDCAIYCIFLGTFWIVCCVAVYETKEVCVLQEMMQIFAVSSSRSLWMPCVPYQRLRCLMRELYRQCGWKLLRGPPSSSGSLLTYQSLILYIVWFVGESFVILTSRLLWDQ